MERRGGETKILKNGSKLGQGVVALKGGEPIHIYTGPILELHWVQLLHSI